MEFCVGARGKTKKYIEFLLPSLISQLKLENSKKLLYIKVDKELEHTGETVPMFGIDTILVVLRPTRDKVALGITLAHEMTHVAQLAKGTLQLTPKGKKWKGKFYRASYPYLASPWEIQAFEKQEILFRRAID